MTRQKIIGINDDMDDELKGVGDNSSDEALRGYVQKVAGLQNKIINLRGDMKNVLNEAKDAGFLKMASAAPLKP